ncbi:MAG: 16S rRNA (cytosine(967)-C(5))-methyltransferase RsmB [Rubricoccaceae bacterium]|nr:16S rRNA (cytosine(967)-C(5))-methyltransferase RsmB [Rubricoccaceae bacterium]
MTKSSSQSSAREEAVRHLIRVQQDGGHVARLGKSAFGPRESRHISDLVAGVTRHRRWLDFLIANFYHGEAHTLDDPVRQILRIGLYEIVERRTPNHAAVSEAVDVAKRFSGPGAAKLVNAVLRAASRAHDADSLPTPHTGKRVRDLAIRYSHPTWLVRKWLEQYGEAETIELLRANNARPSHSLRINAEKITPGDFQELLTGMSVEWEVSPVLDDFVVVPRLQPIIRSGLIDKGLCAVQDQSAGLVVRALDPRPGEFILDCAAAPGGKAIYAAQRMKNRGRVVAIDIHEARTRLIQEAAVKQNETILDIHAADIRSARFDRLFDRVLLDAPCSGLGVLAKRADLRWRMNPEKIKELTTLQDEMLRAASQHVRPGGVLVYSTCTIEPCENEERVHAFIQSAPNFIVERIAGEIPKHMLTAEGFCQTLPHRHQTDGAFAARLRRIESAPS